MVAGLLRNFNRSVGWNTMKRFVLLLLWLSYSFLIYLVTPLEWTWKTYKSQFKEMYLFSDIANFVFSPFMIFVFILVEYSLYLGLQRESDAMYRASAIIREGTLKSTKLFNIIQSRALSSTHS